MFSPLRKPARGLASSLALALSLAGGAAVGTAVFAPSAYAQDYSKEFVAVYQPAANLTQGEAPDFNAAKAQIAAVEAAAKTADDRYAAGNFMLIVGNKLEDRGLQRRGLESMLASGKVEPERVGQFQSFVGNIAYDAGDYLGARNALEAAVAAGYDDPNMRGLIVETFYKQEDFAGGVAYTMNLVQEVESAGGQVPEQWLLRALQSSYDAGLVKESTDVSLALLERFPTTKNWVNATQVIGAVGNFDTQAELDLLRLMRISGALQQPNEFTRYIENADPRIMSNEVEDVLAAGLAAGVFSSGDTYYVDVKSVVDQRKGSDAAEVGAFMRDADSGAGKDALNAADVLYSLDRFADAEKYYAMAAEKGGVDTATALTRKGIAQVQQGKYAEAQATFGEISGARAPLASLWSAYAQSKAG